MPLHRPYRKQFRSAIADLKNLGAGDGGAITAALFLAETRPGPTWTSRARRRSTRTPAG